MSLFSCGIDLFKGNEKMEICNRFYLGWKLLFLIVFLCISKSKTQKTFFVFYDARKMAVFIASVMTFSFN